MKSLYVEKQSLEVSANGLAAKLSSALASLWNGFAHSNQSVSAPSVKATSIENKAQQLGCDMCQFDLVS